MKKNIKVACESDCWNKECPFYQNWFDYFIEKNKDIKYIIKDIYCEDYLSKYQTTSTFK